jgi:hypothetical protein
MLAFLSTKFYNVLVGLLEVHGCFWIFAGVSYAGAVLTFFSVARDEEPQTGIYSAGTERGSAR